MAMVASVTATMKASVLHGPLDLRTEEVPVPAPTGGQVLVKVRASGVCGSDVNSYTGRTYEGTFPYVPGHEWSGDVVEVGEAVASVRKGDRVVGETVVGCGVCDRCRVGTNPNFCRDPTVYGFQTRSPGAFAEYVLREESDLNSLPPSLSHEQGALVEPLTIAYNAVWGLAGGVEPSQTAVVFGAGPVGLLTAAVVKATGARVISVDPIETRRSLALRLGADEAVDPAGPGGAVEEIRRLTGGHGADVAFEASGSDQARTALFDAVDSSSRIVMIGQTMMKTLPIEMEKLVAKGLTVMGAQGSPGMFPRAIEFFTRTRTDLTSIVSHRFPLSEARAALDLASQRTGSVKVLLTA
ncbi:MAG: alcohol dehydrogenase catalytic domain-containing protein [Nitrososphaerales archaeon]